MIQKFTSAEITLHPFESPPLTTKSSGMNYFLPCFQKSSQSDEREFLLPKHAAHKKHQAPVLLERGIGIADKIVDILVAFNAGKLPSQAQLSRFLQHLLSSQLLKEEDGKSNKNISTHGPMSKEGRKVLNDVRNLVQAILQFGLEKNGKSNFV